jgi:hypothetical protein
MNKSTREKAILVRTIYEKDAAFPEWIIEEKNWDLHRFSNTIVFYHKKDSLKKVKLLMKEREPSKQFGPSDLVI